MERFSFDDPRFQIAAARRMLHRNGCDSGIAGHVSTRIPGENAFLITPFEYFDETVPTSVVKVGFDMELIEGDAPVSPALQFHAAFYQRRADVNAIIHTHSHYVSVFTTAARTVGMYNLASVLFHDQQALFADDGSGQAAEGERMVKALGDRRVLLMRHHGAVVLAESLEFATIEALQLEKAARYHLEAEASGGVEMEEKEVLQLLPAHLQYFRQMGWAANLRRLERSDPDLFEYLLPDSE